MYTFYQISAIAGVILNIFTKYISNTNPFKIVISCIDPYITPLKSKWQLRIGDQGIPYV